MPKAPPENSEASYLAPTYVRPPRARFAKRLAAIVGDDEVTVVDEAPLALARNAVTTVARPALHKVVPPHALASAPGVETMLNDVFVRSAQLERIGSVEEAMTFLLDLALEKVPCESGAVLRSHRNALVFIAARGPRAAQVLSAKVRMPLGQGVTGTCFVTATPAVINHIDDDRRYSPRVDGQLDQHTRSLLCAPMQHGGRVFGCLRLTNRRGHTAFEERELGLVEYLASQGAQFISRFST